MARLLTWLHELSSSIGAGLRRFPLMLLCGASAAICAMLAIAPGNTHDPLLLRLIVVSVLGIPLLFLLRLVAEEFPARRVTRFLELAGVLALAGYYITLPDTDDWPVAAIFRTGLLFAACHFAVAFLPAFAAGDRAFWQFNRHLFVWFGTATLFSAVLCGGLELALVSIDHLFPVEVDELSYVRLFFFIAGFVHPLLFVSRVPRNIRALDDDTTYPGALRTFTQFALAPLVAVYVVILYLYAGRILSAWSWPQGWVALPVLILSGVGILSALLLHPLREHPEEHWPRWFFRWFFRALAPLSLLLLLSLHVRISEYGVTEERYFGVVAGGWILVASLVFSLRPRTGIRWIPASLALLCLAISAGPWSAFDVSARSQVRRLTERLREFGLLQEGHAIPLKKELPEKDHGEIESILKYLLEHHSEKPLRPLFATAAPLQDAGFQQQSAWEKTNRLLRWLQISSAGHSDEYSVAHDQRSFSVIGWSRIHLEQRIHPHAPVRCGSLELAIRDGRLQARIDSEPAREVPLAPLIERVSGLPRRSFEDMALEWPPEAPRYRLFFQGLNARHHPDGGHTVHDARVIVLER